MTAAMTLVERLRLAIRDAAPSDCHREDWQLARAKAACAVMTDAIETAEKALEETVAAIEAFEKNHGKAPTKRLHDAAVRGRFALATIRDNR